MASEQAVSRQALPRPTPRRTANPFVAVPGQPVPPWKTVLAYLAAVMLVVAFFWASLAAAGVALNLDFVAQYRVRILDGLGLTRGRLGRELGGEHARGRPRGARPEQPCAAGAGPVQPLRDRDVRGTPLLVQIYLFYYVVGTAWGIDNRVVAGVLILSVFAGAYIAEESCAAPTPRSTLSSSKPPGPWGSPVGRPPATWCSPSRGLALPALAGQFANIVKDSSLLSVISVVELTQTMRRRSAPPTTTSLAVTCSWAPSTWRLRCPSWRSAATSRNGSISCTLGSAGSARTSTACRCSTASTSTTTRPRRSQS